MTTKELILETTDYLVRSKGYNAFSFKDISNSVGIKTASIHYHFPTKADLGICLIQEHIKRLHALKNHLSSAQPLDKLKGFLSIYTKIKSEKNVCLVGTLATDWNTVDENVKSELKLMAESVLAWVIEILEEGQSKGVFHFQIKVRTKALMIITNMLAAVQLTRIIDNKTDFRNIQDEIINSLIKN